MTTLEEAKRSAEAREKIRLEKLAQEQKLLDMFACAALTGLMSSGMLRYDSSNVDEYASKKAFEFGRAMLKARNEVQK